MQPLTHSFYTRPTLKVARALLGKTLVRSSPRGTAAGIIVETEAYLSDDPACHASRGQTKRNAAMFGPRGKAYVYLIYGIHHCFNVVSGSVGQGEAVLIRALAPIAGLELMCQRRRTETHKLLCSGPGRLCQALAITGSDDGADLAGPDILILDSPTPPQQAIVTTTRIGISQGTELPYRMYIRDNPWISRK